MQISEIPYRFCYSTKILLVANDISPPPVVAIIGKYALFCFSAETCHGKNWYQHS